MALGNLDLLESQALMGHVLACEAQHAEGEGFALLILCRIAIKRGQIEEARSYLERSNQALEQAGRKHGLRAAKELLFQLSKNVAL